MLRDLRYAIRRWVARPAFATIAILTLALGIGTTTAIFSVVDAVLLRPLPWKDPDRLVTMWIVRPKRLETPVLAGAANRGVLSWPNFRDAEQQSTAFEAIGVWGLSRPILSGEFTEVARGMFASASFLPMLGVRPHLGRFFEPFEDEQPTDSVLVSYEAWQRRFGADPRVLERHVVLDEQSKTIVGVLPPGFVFEGPAPEFVLPYGHQSASNRTRGNHAYQAVARLKPGVTLQDAWRDVEPILRAGEKPEERTARIEPLASTQIGDSRRPLWMLLSAATLLLLIACTNVAGLLLGDAAARRQEMAVRTALGAARRRLVQSLLADSATLGIAGAILGVLAAALLTPAVVALAPADLPRIDSVGVDARVLAFASGLALLTTLLFGIGPALALSRARPAGALRDPLMAVVTVDTVSNLIRRSMAAEEFRATLSAIFGGAALLLAVVGLYALLSRTVADRVHEIGVRIALGARPHDVQHLILSQGGRLVLLGLLVGLPAALVATRLIASLLYGVSPVSAHVYLIVGATLTAVSLLAMVLPSWRASRIDPMAALREG